MTTSELDKQASDFADNVAMMINKDDMRKYCVLRFKLAYAQGKADSFKEIEQARSTVNTDEILPHEMEAK